MTTVRRADCRTFPERGGERNWVSAFAGMTIGETGMTIEGIVTILVRHLEEGS